MSDNCPKCGIQNTEDLPGGLCPGCLMKAARQSNSMARQGSMGGAFPAPSFSRLAAAFPELEIIELVGQGGMGAVYKARQKDLDRVVALKIFLYRSDDPEFAERFRREARALGQLNHPNIVTVHQFGERDDMHFLLMEFVDGLNLRQITAGQQLDPALAMQLVPQLCDALQYAHEEGVVHRDIKPENILLDARGNIRIADFGLAKLTNPAQHDGLTHTQQVMGTWNYMAPEQKERPTEVDHRADIYSLGVVIYEMLTGELPLGRFPSPSEKSAVDARIDEIVLRALEKDPARRFQQASDFKSSFASLGSLSEVVAASAMPTPPVKHQAGYAGGGSETREHMYQPDTGMRFHIACMSGHHQKGDWTPGNPSLALTCMGGTCLDLSEVRAKQVNVVSFVLMGGCEIVVPHGAHVDVDGFVLMGATDNKVKSGTEVDFPMRVRIRSFGMWGGCEIRTTRAPAPGAQPPMKTQTKPAALWRRLTLLAYQALCLLITIAIPIIFLMTGVGVSGVDSKEFTMIGILVALAAGLFWSQVWALRILLGVQPPEASAEELADFRRATKTGTIIRMFAILLGFACPILFVINSFEHHGRDSEMKFAAIVAGILAAALLIGASYVDEFIRGERAI